MDIAPLGFAVDTAPLEKAAKDLDGFADGAKKLKVSADQAAESVGKLGKASGDSAKAVETANKATAASATGSTKAMADLTAAARDHHDVMSKLPASLAGTTQAAGKMAEALGLNLGGALGSSHSKVEMLGEALGGIMKEFGATGLAIGGTVVALVGAAFAMAKLTAATAEAQDRWAGFNAQVKSVAAGGSDAKQTLSQLTEIAMETGSSVDTVVDSFQRFSMIREDVGATTAQLEGLTKELIEIGKYSNAGAGQTKAAMNAMSQAMSEGRLSGENLRSLLNEMPELVNQLGLGLGKSTSELKAMSEQGQLTGELMFKGLLARADDVKAKMKEVGETTEDAAARSQVAWDKLKAAIGQKIGASSYQQWNDNFEAAVYDGIAKLVSGDKGDKLENLNNELERLQKISEAGGTSFAFGGAFGSNDEIRTRIELLKRLADEEKKRRAEQDHAESIAGLAGRIGRDTDTGLKAYDPDVIKARELVQEREKYNALLTQSQSAVKEFGRIADENDAKAVANAKAIAEWKAKAAGATTPQGKSAAEAQLRILQAPATIAAKARDDITATYGRMNDINLILTGIDQRAANIGKDAVDKLRDNVQRMEDALAKGGGGYSAMWRQAAEMAENTKNSVEDTFAVLEKQKRLESITSIIGTEKQAAAQMAQARAIAAGGGKIGAEATAESATWAFQQFGDRIAENQDIVDRYTASLIQMKLAQAALGDTTEIDKLRDSLSELAAAMNVVTSGGGAYAQRKAKFEAGLQSWQQERTANITSVSSAPAGVSGSVSGGARAAGGTASMQAMGGGRQFIPAQHSQTPVDIIRFFQSKGFSLDQAWGIAGGIMSESGGDEHAYNKGSGAAGLGQWLGSRRAGINARYGPHPTRQQQLEYINWELHGGDYGGAAVMRETTRAGVAAAYVSQFMRPGKDTAKGVRRAVGIAGGGYVGDGVLAPSTATGAGPGVDAAQYGADGKTIAALRRSQFQSEESLRSESFIRGLNGVDGQAQANNRRAEAARTGDPAKMRELELELKIEQAVADNDPAYATRIRAAMVEADAAERRAKAEADIAAAKQNNDDNDRRNAAAATGSVARMQELELELKIEQIKRNAPAAQQGELIEQARRESEGQRAASMARMQAGHIQQAQAMADQLALMKYTGDELEVQQDLLKARNELLAAGIDPVSEQGQEYLRIEESLARQNVLLQTYKARIEGLRDNAKQTASEIGDGFAKMFSESFKTGKINADFALHAIEQAFYGMLDRITQQLIISPIVDFLTKVTGNFITGLLGGKAPTGGSTIVTPSALTPGLTTTALGGVFDSNGLVPFAHGGIVNTPTRFSMGGGRQGLAGEGPGLYEAMMPLKRGPDGKLGVAGVGGSGGAQVVVFDQRSSSTAEPVQIVERQAGNGQRQINVMIRDAVRANIRDGAFDSDQRSVYGLERTVIRR